MTSIIAITGGVCSSLGKGLLAASLGRLMVDRGLTIRVVKLDPYLNQDPGTLSPAEHGECWVTEDGVEADLDLGHYERFTSVNTSGISTVTAGSVYQRVLNAERRGDYLGNTVQVIPHITDEIKRRLVQAADADTDLVIAEIGGTVGDIEIQPFLEALRQLKSENDHQVCNVHLALVPHVGPSQELKTKPCQASVTLLRSFGISPDVLVARSTPQLPEHLRTKLARSCGLSEQNVIFAPDVSSIYAVPSHLASEKLDEAVLRTIGLEASPRNSERWESSVAKLITPAEAEVTIGVVGKYHSGHDTYLSVGESLRHAAAAEGLSADIRWIDADEAAADVEVLQSLDGIVVPGGFGQRSVEGKIAACGFARNTGIPLLGLCLGLQVAVVEFARAVAGVSSATSGEWSEPGPQVVALLDSQAGVSEKGGSMRLGAYPAVLAPGSAVAEIYGMPAGGKVSERHRHRYEVNPAFVEVLEAAGLVVSGRSPDGSLVEFVELPEHKFFVATQAHPELKSRPGEPHPLFSGLVRAARRDVSQR